MQIWPQYPQMFGCFYAWFRVQLFASEIARKTLNPKTLNPKKQECAADSRLDVAALSFPCF